MILTITKCLNKTKLVKAIRLLHPNITLSECYKMVNDLPYINAGIYNNINGKNYCSEEIGNLLNGAAEYTFELDVLDLQYLIDRQKREEFQIEFNKAKLWYDKLSEQDKYNVDILTRLNIPT